MDHPGLKADLDKAIHNFEKQVQHIQSLGMAEDVQDVANILSSSMLNALKEFRDAVLKHSN